MNNDNTTPSRIPGPYLGEPGSGKPVGVMLAALRTPVAGAWVEVIEPREDLAEIMTVGRRFGVKITEVYTTAAADLGVKS